MNIDEDNEEYSPKKKELFEERRRNKRKEGTASCFLNVCAAAKCLLYKVLFTCRIL